MSLIVSENPSVKIARRNELIRNKGKLSITAKGCLATLDSDLSRGRYIAKDLGRVLYEVSRLLYHGSRHLRFSFYARRIPRFKSFSDDSLCCALCFRIHFFLLQLCARLVCELYMIHTRLAQC